MIVYITDSDAIGWVYDNLPERLRPAVTEFQQLTGLARSKLSKKQIPAVNTLLAPALYAGLLTPDGADVIRPFEGARTFIHAKATQSCRLAYVLLSLGFCVLIAILPFVISKYIGLEGRTKQVVLLGIAGGVSGAVVSIVQRARNLKIDPLDSAVVLGLHGLTRVCLGGIFGVLLMAAVQANIVLGHFATDDWALFGLAAGAGFTERWVPELLGGHDH